MTKISYFVIITALTLVFSLASDIGLAQEQPSTEKKIPLKNERTNLNTGNELYMNIPSNNCINAFDQIATKLEKFVKAIDKDIPEVMRSCIANKYLDTYVCLMTCSFEKKFPNVSHELDNLFSENPECQWIYIFLKDKPFYGIYFYRLPNGETRANGRRWGSTDFLIETEPSHQWIRRIIESNLALGKGYIWYNDEKIFVRPRQILKSYTGECIYLFGYSEPPVLFKDAPPN